jgi:type II secretory pathway component PulF
MPTFQYRAKNGTQNMEGTIEAQTRDEAIEKIHQKGYVPVRVEKCALKVEVKAASGVKGRLSAVKSKNVTIFSRQLASLIKSGVPILRGIKIIADQSDNLAFRRILNEIHSQVTEGKALSDILPRYPKVFPPLYVAMVRSGETSGTLQEVLMRIADYRQKQEQMLSQVRAALAYPAIMAVTGIGTIIFMLTFVMPRLMRIFSKMGQELPFPTQMLITTSEYLQRGWLGIIIGVIVFVFLVKQTTRSRTQRLALSRLKLQIPFWGAFILKNELARFNRTLELLLKSSISILKAIRVAIPVLDNDAIKEELARCSKDLEEGGSFGKSLEKSKLFPGFMTSLISVGEEAGRLDEALSEIASSYERDTDETLKILTSLLEPVIILLMGLIVGFIVIAMLLPVFQMNMMTG